MTTTSRTLKQSMEYSGKLTVIEDKVGKAYKLIVALAENLPKTTSPQATMSKQYTDFLKAKQAFERALPPLRKDLEWSQWSSQTCTDLREEDFAPKWTNNMGSDSARRSSGS